MPLFRDLTDADFVFLELSELVAIIQGNPNNFEKFSVDGLIDLNPEQHEALKTQINALYELELTNEEWTQPTSFREGVKLICEKLGIDPKISDFI